MVNKLSKEEIKERDDVIKRVYDKRKSTDLVLTGISKIDEVMGGLEAGNIMVLGGDTGIGKSLFAMTMAVNVAKQGHNVLYIDLENGEQLGITRLLSIWSGKEYKHFKDPESEEEAKEIYREIAERIDYWDHVLLQDTFKSYDENTAKTIIDLIKAKSINKSTKPRLIIIDPLQALESEIDGQRQYNEQGKLSKDIKNLSQRLNNNVIICHHFRKPDASSRYVRDIDESEGSVYRVPDINDFKGSSKIVENSQMVCAIMRQYKSDTKSKRSKSKFMILKNRDGLEHEGIKIHFDEDTLTFKDEPVEYSDDYSMLTQGLGLEVVK